MALPDPAYKSPLPPKFKETNSWEHSAFFVISFFFPFFFLTSCLRKTYAYKSTQNEGSAQFSKTEPL